ncbi:hypothetical protein HZS55_18800 [Halosimplex rubrum]|uniref:Uncharacterized protein n=1 Tax=Halosimplex rubrum TaxID=869889 RepID=A0A7D5T7Q5_9EURY|nr:hypothetical protein [Halosimplex rubrum]QLH79213.1 hypothetical protein HZS55_18800 [Halosimplex rubrum]
MTTDLTPGDAALADTVADVRDAADDDALAETVHETVSGSYERGPVHGDATAASV